MKRTIIAVAMLSMLPLLFMASAAHAVVIDNYVWQFPVVSGVTGADDLIARLQNEAQQILDAGHLRPARPYMSDQATVETYLMYQEPFRVVTTLAWAYPYLTTAQQTAARSYVANELNTLAYTPWRVNTWENCKLTADSAGANHEDYPRDRVNWGPLQPDPEQARPTIQSYYGLWLYGFRTGDWATIQAKWTNIKNDYNGRSAEGAIYGTYGAHIGIARLAQQFNDTAERDTAIANLQTQMNAGVTFATVETNCWNIQPTYWHSPYRDMWDARKDGLVYRGFMFLNVSPEVGRYLNDNVRTDVLARHNVGKTMYPLWWLRRPNYWCRWTGDEGVGTPSELMGMILPIERWVVGANAATLRRYMRSAPMGKGDCYWLESLVQAIEATGSYTWADVRTAGSPPNPPSNLSATTISSSQINLAWTDNSSNETQFKIERKTGSGGTYAQIATVGANVTAYNNTGLAASTTYYYRVRANNANGDSAYCTEAYATTQSGGGGGNLILNPGFETGDITSWSWNGGSTGGSISTADKHGGTYSAKFDATVGRPELNQSFATANGTQYTVTGWVRIVTQTGSDWGGFRILASDANWTALGSVSLLQAQTGTNWYQFSFTFSAISTSSRLQIKQFSGSALVQVVYVDDLSVTGPGGAPPNAPSNLSALAVSSSQINLTWTDNSTNETGFKLERKAGAGGTYGQIATPAANATSYSDTGLAASTLYYYRIRATNGSGDSAYSAEAYATTSAGPPNAPSNLSATTVSSSQINLAWTDNSSNETQFKIERKTGSGGTYAQIGTVGANVTTYNNTGLASSTLYYYRVRANNAAGDSAYSNEAYATTNAVTAVGLAFNGTSSQASRADSASLDIAGNAMTMEAWVNLTAADSWNYMDAVGRQEISSDNGWTRWHGIVGYANGNSWKFGLVIGTTYYQAQSGSTLPKNQWVHVAGSYDGANIRFFVNGIVAATTAATGNLFTNNNTWYLGSNGSGEWFGGNIDEVRISNNARYTANFTPPAAAFSSDANTKALWHLQENTGTTSADSSGNSNTLTLTSTTWTTGKF